MVNARRESRATARSQGLLAWSYVALLCLIWALFRWVGERHWSIALLLYVPRMVWAIPLLGFGVSAVRSRMASVYAPSSVALVVWLGPLMGLRWSSGEALPHASAPPRVVRMFVQNVHGFPQVDGLLAQLRAIEPELIVLQEAGRFSVDWWEAAIPDREWHRQGEHILGSRFPVKRAVGAWDKGYVRYDMELGAEQVSLFSIHPPSPQFALRHVLRGPAPEHPKEWSSLAAFDVLDRDVQQRRRVLQAIARDAQLVSNPVIIAGDSNTPDGGRVLRDHFSDWTDAFDRVGTGFGYTFPSQAPWLRLDRVWVTPRLRVISVRQDNSVRSDHRALVVELAPPWSW